jgi:hypothetical protein
MNIDSYLSITNHRSPSPRHLLFTTVTPCSLHPAGLLPEDVAPTQPPALLATQLVRGLAGLATVEVAQGELAAQGLLLRDILRWVSGVCVRAGALKCRSICSRADHPFVGYASAFSPTQLCCPL